jgi:diacylglycerol kinase
MGLSSSPPTTKPPVEQLPQKSEWAKFLASFGYAFQGLWYALSTQRNARLHAVIATLATILGIVLRISAVEFAIIFMAIAGVFIAEMFNTVFELCVDLASPEYHPLAKIAKDVAAGAVLLSAILSIIIGLFIFGPHLWILFIKK